MLCFYRSCLLISFATLMLLGCGSNGGTSAQPATRPTMERDGRNLAPAVQPYATDPLWPYNEHNGGGGGRR